MPFISKDWRSGGEIWVKTEETGGWEKLKNLECGKRKRMPSSSEEDTEHENNATSSPPPPHCHITIRCTREIAGFNGLGEAVQRLDFRSSVHDRRRFHYICALLRLLVAGKGIANLPGSAQKLLLRMIEEVAAHVNDNQQNINVLRGLALQLQDIVNQENQKCWGKPLGSPNLWNENVRTIKRIQSITSQIKIKEPGPEIRPKIHDLPEECVREIILRIADHRDLESAAGAWKLMASLTSEQRVWRELCTFHFNKKQMKYILDKNKLNHQSEIKDWKKIYHDLRRTFGVSEDYQFAEVLSLCKYCCCLFWPSDGHPCIIDQSPDLKARLEESNGGQLEISQPVPPSQFLKFFSL
ncbi:FBXO32 family protein [Megaselia abdita]